MDSLALVYGRVMCTTNTLYSYSIRESAESRWKGQRTVGNTDPRTLKDRVVVVTGASRGIGTAIAVRAAADGAAIALLARTEAPNPKIAGTLAESADAVQAAGGQALPVVGDVRAPAA